MNLLYNEKSIPSALMNAALHEQDLLCRSFGIWSHGRKLDNEMGDLIDQTIHCPAESKLFTYTRYNAELSRKGLDELKLTKINSDDVQMLDSVKHIDKLKMIGKAIAKEYVKLEPFKGFL